MKFVIEIPDNIYRNCCSIPLNSVERAVKNGKPLDSVLDEIKAEANADCISDGIGRYIRFDVLEKNNQ